MVNLNSPILIIGGYPPPYGGVTVHIERFVKICEKYKIPISVVSQFNSGKHKYVINLKGNRIFKLFHLIYILVTFKGKIVHIHGSAFSNFLYGGLFIHLASSSKIKILTIHGGEFKIPQKNRLIYNIYKFLLTRFDYIVCLNQIQQSYFKDILNINDNKLPIIPSYIPLTINPKINKPKLHRTLKEIKEKSDYVVFSSGYLTGAYGFDILLDAVKKIKEFNIGVIFAFYTFENHIYKNKLEKKIKTYPLVWQFKNIESDEFLYLLQNSDLMVRPSRADTYGMILGDAINLGTPAIASDVCERFPGTIIFKKNNVDDLIRVIKKTFNNYETVKKNIFQNINTNFGENLLNFYNNILSKI